LGWRGHSFWDDAHDDPCTGALRRDLVWPDCCKHDLAVRRVGGGLQFHQPDQPFDSGVFALRSQPFVETPTRYLGGVFSGISIGAAIALGAIFFSKKAAAHLRSWIAIGQIYLAYGFASLTGVSAVSASLTSVIAYAVLAVNRKLWQDTEIRPMPLNTWPGFGILLALFVFLGWQAHQPISTALLLEVLVGYGIGMLVAGIGRLLKLSSFSGKASLWKAGLSAAVLLFPALLLWPRHTIEQPALLAYAFGLAGLVLALSRITLDHFSEE